jgi:curved DNA-binding protein CbpA
VADEAEIKRLYRQLARRFHPDLAVDEADRTHRTEKMAAVNNAYAARSLTELVALAREAKISSQAPGQTEAQMIQALQAELERCQHRLRQIPHRPSVQLSLEVKMARRQGRDLLGQMAKELEHKIARKTVERDLLKAQFAQLGPDQGFIPLRKPPAEA